MILNKMNVEKLKLACVFLIYKDKAYCLVFSGLWIPSVHRSRSGGHWEYGRGRYQNVHMSRSDGD